MSDLSVALQTTVYNALVGNSPLTTKLGGNKIYDFVPESTSFPYVKIGTGSGTDNGTKSEKGNDYTLVIDTFSYHYIFGINNCT